MELTGIDIAAYSMSLASSNMMTNVSIAMLDNAMEVQEMMGQQMAKMMELSVTPSLGGNLDIQV